MPQQKSILTCRACGQELPRESFDNRYKPDGGPRGKKPTCRECLAQNAEAIRSRVEIAYMPNRSGLCACGCGQPVPRAKVGRPSRGWIKGEYVRFAVGHGGATASVEYIVDTDTGCWIWQRGQDGHGYGAKFNGTRMDKAHRMYYRRYKGDIPEGMDLHHTCATPACVNPDHLIPMDRMEHMAMDGRLAKVRSKR